MGFLVSSHHSLSDVQWDLVEAMEATEAARRNPAGLRFVEALEALEAMEAGRRNPAEFRFVEALEATEAGPGEAQPGFGSRDVTRRKDHAWRAFGMHSLCGEITTEG